MFPRPIQEASASRQLLYKIGLPISLVIWLLPMIAIIATAGRSLSDINYGNYWGIPSEWAFVDNFSAVFNSSPILWYLVNSVIITVPAIIGTLFLSTLAGAGLALYKFKGHFVIFAIFIAGNFVPYQILMIPVRHLTVNLGIYDTYWAVILFQMAFQTGFCTFFMRNFIAELPFELVESARSEGVSEWKILIHIIVPLVRPALAALAVLEFTFVWNDFFWPLILIQSDEIRPITLGLTTLKGQYISSFNLLAAGSLIAALPPVMMFFAMQRHFIAGLTLGASKG
ncbi:ABC-type sugar transport system, permease component [Hoeflea phototrophica DFL-43]|jgi:multiple sugar transport system permease protein|uniref:sn-glycerol-3-phosphate transport system permease protein UgpE n=1 Tax=Hoeflea phototrophica (strain DSM 17068 / NCIMB 14078 / DFL-43) TaxID=411684 RepID=A9D019_HOEPD|nr:carbohydrate ABC transporter permease [Hoeflea phototrophica]EDQ34904.1 ABC-type sugar transport system, permease component [Hoeflea phototrophica DFL-43]